ncbi:LysR family transcriptional regulator [Burkholderia sp. Se-20373]|nr:LysR family transcriptional regulator [Burkholderia sp. Se-20373]
MFRQLEQFLVLAETTNFRRAAEQLNMARPPPTASIRHIDLLLGMYLLERRSRVTSSSAAGKVLREETRRTVEQS